MCAGGISGSPAEGVLPFLLSGDDFEDFHRRMLQRTIDMIWWNVRWVERRGEVRVIPLLPGDNEFRRNLIDTPLWMWGLSPLSNQSGAGSIP